MYRSIRQWWRLHGSFKYSRPVWGILVDHRSKISIYIFLRGWRRPFSAWNITEKTLNGFSFMNETGHDTKSTWKKSVDDRRHHLDTGFFLGGMPIFWQYAWGLGHGVSRNLLGRLPIIALINWYVFGAALARLFQAPQNSRCSGLCSQSASSWMLQSGFHMGLVETMIYIDDLYWLHISLYFIYLVWKNLTAATLNTFYWCIYAPSGTNMIKALIYCMYRQQLNFKSGKSIYTSNDTGLILGLRPANETALLCNDVSHWMVANLESALW